MKIAHYWTRGDGEALNPKGERIHAWARGWSDESVESARARARDLARRVAERIASGSGEKQRYPYGDRPLPEPIIREFDGAMVTRNAYGALVLNTDHLLFADIDAKPAASGRSWGRAFSSLFGKAKAPAFLEKLTAVTTRHGRMARVYQTAAGFRLMIIDASYRPGSPETEALLAEYDTDPLYVRLCRMQESFRARLTPKPWRCGMRIPPGAFPYETSDALNRYKEWESDYNAKASGYATCRLVTQLGSGFARNEFRELIDFHDRETKATEELRLA
jgi:hypothetical protein